MKSLIGTNWVDAKSGNVIEVFNPANGKLVDTVPSLSKEEVDAAVAEIIKRSGKIDILFNNAGVCLHKGKQSYVTKNAITAEPL